MRQTYIVAYDISDQKRLRQVFKTMKGWGDHLQLSVFRADLSRAEVVQLRRELSEIIDKSVDQVLFVDIGPADGRALTCFETIGRPTPPAMRTAIVV